MKAIVIEAPDKFLKNGDIVDVQPVVDGSNYYYVVIEGKSKLFFRDRFRILEENELDTLIYADKLVKWIDNFQEK